MDFEKIVKYSPIGIFVIGKDDGKFLYVNDKLLEIYGNDIPKDVVYCDIFKFCIRDYMDTVDYISIVDMLKSVKGDIDVYVECFKFGDKLAGYCNIIEEIIDDDKKYNDLKSIFFNNITHTIRTPLNNIVGFSNLLIDTDNKSKQRAHVEIIKRNSNLLIKSINNILDITNIGVNDIVISNNKCILLDIINEVCDEYRSRLVEGVDLYVDSSTNVIIYSDRERIKHILSNLVSNSVKFTTDGHIKIGFKVRHKNIVFYVEDTGVGIIKDNFNNIFDEFTHTDSRGSGLGLPIVKRLLGAMGGDVWLESEPMKGSTFYFTIPSDFSQEI